MDGNQIIDGILAKGNEMIGHLQEAYLFRSSFAYLSTNLLLLYKGIEALKNRKLDEKQIQSLKQLQQSFNHFDSFLPHLSQSKWMQPALNWPVGYVHRLIDGFRKNVILLIEPLGLDKIEIPTSSNSSQNSSNSNSTQNHSNNSNNSSSNNNSNSNNNSSNNSYNSNNNNSSSNNNHNHNNNDINNNNENNGQNSPNSQNSQNTPNSSAEFKSKEKKLFVFDETQDYINRRADFNHFKSSLAGMMSQINTNDAVGIQQQIELKIHEISKILSNNPKNVNDQTNIDQKKVRNPSCDFSMIQMKKRVAELLGQFKSINIENDDLMIQAPLGAGGFGSVCKAIRLSTGEIVAVKELRMDRLTMSSWASLYSELEAMASVRHSFVLELVGAHITEPFRIITRFCSGKSLFDRLHRKNHGFESLSPTQLTTIAYQVAVGMEYLHSKNIVHRDLKTLNILLDEYCDGFVADFGLSGMMKDNQDLCGGVGTPNYTAPEVLAHSRYGNKVDIYSYGVVLWELLTKKVPYSEMSSMAIYEHVVTRGWRLPIPNDAPNGLKKLIARCWAKNPSDRPSFCEIVQLFEKENLYLAGSKKIDFMKIKKSKKCPPIAFDYAINVLKDLDSPHFDSVCHYIGNHCDERVRKELRQQNILKNLLESYSNEKNNLNKFCFPESDKENIQDSTENSKNSQKECEKTQNENNLNENHQNLTENKNNFKENPGNMPKAKTEKVNSPKSIGKKGKKGKKKCISDHFNAILTLAEALLENEEEINSFLENGGKEIFKFCITKNNPDFLMAAMSFSLILPKNILFDLHIDLKLIFGFIEKNKKGEITNYFIRFLSNLPISQIVDYKLQIVKLLLEISENINDQETFNSIVSLLPLCMDAIEKNQFRAFYSLLNHDFIVPASFVRTLIQTNDVESYPSLFLNMIRATIKSDLTDVLIHFLQKCKRENTGVIDEIWKQPNFSELTDKLLQSDSNKAALFLLFCIASNEEAALFLADSTILNTLIQMSKLKIQRLQIFTLLCMHESFCEKTTYLDGINHLLVSSLSIRTLTIHAFNLIGALSKHITTCQLLTDNGVLELFTQIFLSSYRGNNSVSYAILRNVAKNISFIPQSSLIVSCLMQELSTARIEKLEILATISSIVEVIPGSVQEHDIQRIIIPEMSKEDPQFALYSLKLLSVCDPSLFRSIYLPVFAIIIKILNNPKMLYPELIESSLDVMIVIVQQYDVSEFIKKTEFIRYLSELLNLIEPTDPLCPSISGFLSILEHIV